MSALDLSSSLMVAGLLILRLGTPILGIWLMGLALRRIAPQPPA